MSKISETSYTSSLISMQFGVRKPHSQSGQPENHSFNGRLKPEKLFETAESCMAWSIRAVVGCCPEPKGPKFTSLAAENAVKYPPTNRDDWKYTPKKRMIIFVGTNILYWLLRCRFFLGDAQWFWATLGTVSMCHSGSSKGYVSGLGVQWVKNHPNSPGFCDVFLHLEIPLWGGVLGGRSRDLPLV